MSISLLRRTPPTSWIGGLNRILIQRSNKEREMSTMAGGPSVKKGGRSNMKEKLNSYIKLETTRELSRFYGGLSITKMQRRRGGTSYIPFLVNLEKRLDVVLHRLHFCDTIPQARQLISHGKVCVNNKMVSLIRFKVSPGDIISFQD